MKAMVLAAGMGTRLRPLTEHRPKALVEIGGRTLLEITLTRLRTFGVRDVIVNVHHFAAAILDFLKANGNFGMRIEVSREEVLLDTGGGLKKAGWFFLEEGKGAPFLLHNVDVISTIDFQRMVQRHKESEALATLAVQARETSRYLLFNEQLHLCGRRIVPEQKDELVRAPGGLQALAFTGVHVISPRLLTMMKEEGAFSIIDLYLRLAGEGENVTGYRADDYYWRDLGKLDQVQQAEEDYKRKLFT
jgi:NDP-sugar pyrophosphorylase family protein